MSVRPKPTWKGWPLTTNAWSRTRVERGRRHGQAQARHRRIVPFFWIAPGIVGGLLPWTLTSWQVNAPLLGVAAGRWLGGLLVVAGAIVVVECFVRFATSGLGAPAPVAPTAVLVVSGLYYHVRNPMYLGVASVIFGQALVFGSSSCLRYGAFVWLLFHAFVMLYEEPTRQARHGASYETYRANVRRWLPRLGPWIASSPAQTDASDPAR
jgi:protein-S-isoprenylcysteine O-methyltransferase Ste14